MASTPQALIGLLWHYLVPITTIALLSVLAIVASLAYSQNAPVPQIRSKDEPVHLLVVLGSGGHTTEMFYMLQKIPLDPSQYTHRTYVVSSGDKFSASKAKDFESDFLKSSKDGTGTGYTIVTIPRARRVHQSYWTAPFSTLHCLLTCFLVLLGQHPDQQRLPPEYPSVFPDLILTNGPAIAVCMILAAKVIRFFIFLSRWASGHGTKPAVARLRTIFVESWARVRTLSTSGVLLLPLADQFLVQWPDLAGRRAWWGMKKTEYVGWTVL